MVKPNPLDHNEPEPPVSAPDAAEGDPVKLPGVVAPDSIMSQETKEVLTAEFDQKIAGTGGIQQISAEKLASGHLQVTITGTIQDGLARDKDRAEPGEQIAPNFNSRTSSLLKAGDVNLSHYDWQRAHVWGPGFGDEAAAGIWFASRDVNNMLQNQVAEKLIRDLSTEAAAHGGTVELTATAQRFSIEDLPEEHKQGEFLRLVDYRITLKTPEGDREHFVRFAVNPPPDGSIERDSLRCDPTTAEYIGARAEAIEDSRARRSRS